MKKTLALVLVAVIACLTLVSCNTLDKVMDMISGKTESAADLWDSATYNSDAEFGEGDKTVEVEVRVEDKSVTFTINFISYFCKIFRYHSSHFVIIMYSSYSRIE